MIMTNKLNQKNLPKVTDIMNQKKISILPQYIDVLILTHTHTHTPAHNVYTI